MELNDLANEVGVKANEVRTRAEVYPTRENWTAWSLVAEAERRLKDAEWHLQQDDIKRKVGT